MFEDICKSYEKRAKAALNPAAKALFRLMAKKRTNLSFSDDATDPKRFLELADRIGPEIAVLKTHIDVLDEFAPSVAEKLLELSRKHNFMIFEDRKFADIGNTVRLQYARGIYRIADWANVVNLHIISGPGIIEGIGSVIREKKDGIPRGILIIAQMSSEGTLATEEYTRTSVGFGNANKDLVAGYIGGARPEQVRELVGMSFAGHFLITPGVQIKGTKDALGQRYTSPEDAVTAGADCIIVGRGIYNAKDPLKAAKAYRKAGWDAYLKRTKA